MVCPLQYRRTLSLVGSMLLAIVFVPQSIQGENLATDIAGILATRCLECHSGAAPEGALDLSSYDAALRGGESGPAVAPGDADASLLWNRIAAGDMPPEDSAPLTDQQRLQLREWLQSGATYPAAGIDRYQYSTESRAGYDWWSLNPIVAPAVPIDNADEWSRNAIDRFVWNRLNERGLRPNDAADPLSLVRRLYFDLTGLPPTPEQVAEFVSTPSDEAYEKLVDQLLASPRYGERWARHWLDVARFGESDGFERNNVRDNQWRYRDWVIRALNSDMPYDQFVRLQIAGDLIQGDSRGIAAVGFLTAGVHNTVVGGSEFMKKTARQDELEEIAGTVGQTFVGLTVNCARCHDHKFDPIPQREYYQFTAALAGVYHGERDFQEPELANELQQLQEQRQRLTQQIHEIEEPARARALAMRSQDASALKRVPRDSLDAPTADLTWTFDIDCDDQTHQLAGTLIGNARIEGGALIIDDDTSFAETSPLMFDVGPKTLEAVVMLSDLDQRGGGAISIQNQNGDVFDAIVYGEREPRRWMAGSNGFARSQNSDGDDEAEAIERPVHLAIVYDEDGTIRRYRDGQPYGADYGAALQRFSGGDTVFRFGLRHLPAGGNKHLSGRILLARFYNRALSAEEVLQTTRTCPSFVDEQQLAGQLDAAQVTRRAELTRQRTEVTRRWNEVKAKLSGKIYTVTARVNPGETKLLRRGNAMDELAVVRPGAIAAIRNLNADFQLPADAPDAQRRVALAQWLTDPQNPLTSRVIVNRVWHHHFGVGIVETPNDFGFNGGRPSHPQLLDWLATEFIQHNWSLKELHRTIVLSATYRQSSRRNAEAMRQDAQNRLLWRHSPVRLDAESLRDAMLAISGQLDLRPYGPGFRDVKVEYLDGTTYYTPIDELRPEFCRRTIYRFSPRGGRSALLDTFDCPDPATTAPKRSTTTTPLQALALLNDKFVWDVSQHTATRIRRDVGDDQYRQIVRAFALTYGRSPEDAEVDAVELFLKSEDLPSLVRVLINATEFVWIP
ncbi:MAG: DUF1553 domain-containing protein [Pirellulaceae bacterium]|nr:DUF1553 domain-containing protein [Planctomycetales bacterium]